MWKPFGFSGDDLFLFVFPNDYLYAHWAEAYAINVFVHVHWTFLSLSQISIWWLVLLVLLPLLFSFPLCHCSVCILIFQHVEHVHGIYSDGKHKPLVENVFHYNYKVNHVRNFVHKSYILLKYCCRQSGSQAGKLRTNGAKQRNSTLVIRTVHSTRAYIQSKQTITADVLMFAQWNKLNLYQNGVAAAIAVVVPSFRNFYFENISHLFTFLWVIAKCKRKTTTIKMKTTNRNDAEPHRMQIKSICRSDFECGKSFLIYL